MADFLSGFWSFYIAGITLVGIAGCAWVLWSNMTAKVKGPVQTMGHTWDETLEEYNNPLPSWWVWLFVITIIFALGYLTLYPGLGSNKGTLGWSSTGQYDAEIVKAGQQFDPIFDRYAKLDLKEVAADPQAHQIGERLFLTYCSQCHGSDARGAKGFPNLTDKDWLGEGSAEYIEQTILNGRMAAMPSMAAVLGTADDVANMAQYVLSLSGSGHDAVKAALAKDKFMACAACHGPEAKGNPAIGAPNLTDKTWLYGGSAQTITETITLGRTNQMPSFRVFLGEAKIHLVAAYVWSLSNKPEVPAKTAMAE